MPMTTTPPSSWIIEIYFLNGNLLQNVTIQDPTNTSHIWSGLMPGTMYLVRVAGVNTRGVGNYSELAKSTYLGTNTNSSVCIDVNSIFFFELVPNTFSTGSVKLMAFFPGTPVRLYCTFSGIPQPVLLWYKDGTVLNNEMGKISIVENSSRSDLIVMDSSGEQGGEYNCTGFNKAGQSSTTFVVECMYIIFIYFTQPLSHFFLFQVIQ